MPRKTQLADEIADLLNPAPTAEQGDDDEFVSSSQKPLGLLADDDVALEPSRSGGRRMRAAIDMSATGSKYAGRVISRDSLDRRRRLPSHPEPSGVDDDDSGEAEEDDGDGDEVDDDEELDDDDELDHGRDGVDFDGEQEEDWAGEEGEEGEEGSGAPKTAALYDQWQDMASQEAELLTQLQQTQRDEAQRAAVAKQQARLATAPPAPTPHARATMPRSPVTSAR